jgi:acylphosphatase
VSAGPSGDSAAGKGPVPGAGAGDARSPEEPGSPAGDVPVVRVRVFVDGRVQGVGFRAGVAREAMRLGVRGWARNLPDGRVEAVYEGPPDAVEDMLVRTRHGPAAARVTEMSIHDEEPKGERGFKVC